MMLPTESWMEHSGRYTDAFRVRTLTARDFRCPDADPFVEEHKIWLPSDVGESDDTPLFSGIHEARWLSCGAKIEISALTAVCDGRYGGTLKRSLMVVMVIDGAALDLAVGEDSELAVQRGQALLVTMRDAEAIVGIHQKGNSSRCLLLQTRPEDIADPDLAALVDQAVARTAVTRLPVAYRFWAMADAVFGPGSICRLVEESCALGLLAEALHTLTGGESAAKATATVTAGDRRKMLRVRDLLLAEPDREHRLADLAREAGVGVTALKTKFTAVFGQSVLAYLRDLRLDRARAGIVHEGWTASQAAYAVGYRNPGGFSGAFRRKFGMLPSDLRRHAKTRPPP